MNDRIKSLDTIDSDFAFSADCGQAFIPHCSTAKLWTLEALRLAQIIKHLASVFVEVL
jgi:hypothetical protein